MNGQGEQLNGEQDGKDEIAEESTNSEAEVEAPATDAEDPMEALQAKADENRNNYLRAAAELENVRKRAARDVENARKFALERFGADLLDVRDSLELGLKVEGEADAEHLRAGSEATLKLLTRTMERFGVEEVDPQGEPFDPELHEAMTMQPSADVEPGSVLTVFQKGYTLNGRLLRPARVVVAQEPQDSNGGPEESE
jgi:molecular chaperone GrpE